MKQDIIFLPDLVSIFAIFAFCIVVIGPRYYKLDSALLRIKSSKKTLSGQEVLNLCGSVFCCSIPMSFIIFALDDVLASPLACILCLATILCLILIIISSIYVLISNLVISTKPDFIKEIVLDKKNACIKAYSNVDTKIIPFEDITSFSVYNTTANVPNVKPGYVRSLGISGALISGAENARITTDITIIISTINNGTIKIHTTGNVLFDHSSEKLLETLKQYRTVFKNFRYLY